jgi:hypothetical protein
MDSISLVLQMDVVWFNANWNSYSCYVEMQSCQSILDLDCCWLKLICLYVVAMLETNHHRQFRKVVVLVLPLNLVFFSSFRVRVFLGVLVMKWIPERKKEETEKGRRRSLSSEEVDHYTAISLPLVKTRVFCNTPLTISVQYLSLNKSLACILLGLIVIVFLICCVRLPGFILLNWRIPLPIGHSNNTI